MVSCACGGEGGIRCKVECQLSIKGVSVTHLLVGVGHLLFDLLMLVEEKGGVGSDCCNLSCERGVFEIADEGLALSSKCVLDEHSIGVDLLRFFSEFFVVSVDLFEFFHLRKAL